MDIKYRIYPHPVLWDKSDDYKNSKFDCSIRPERGLKRFILNVDFELTNKILTELIKDGKAEYVLHIESPATSYRLVKSTSDDKLKFSLLDEHLMGKVSLCPFVVAKVDFSNYTNDDFNQDYENISFDIQKGEILAIGNQHNLKVDKEKENLSQIPSIFTIYKIETAEETGMEIELFSQKIRIGLNIIDYENYNIAARTMPEVINSFIILPVLVYAFEQIKGNFDDFGDYRWFQAIEKLFKKYSLAFNEELLNAKTSIELVQKIMGFPISSALKRINVLDNTGEED